MTLEGKRREKTVKHSWLSGSNCGSWVLDPEGCILLFSLPEPLHCFIAEHERKEREE
jgi:hypothetical protein